MQHAWCNTYSLDVPVTAVAVGAQRVCLAIGNRVLATGASAAGGVYQVAELPNGAVITALEMHPEYAGVVIVVVIGTGDRVYIAPLCSGGSSTTAPAQLVADGMERVLRIRSLGPGVGVLVLSALNSAFVLSEKRLATANTSPTTAAIGKTHPLPSVMKYAVTGLGVALAADAMEEAGDKSVAVFSGTYAGGIAAWRVPVAVTLHSYDCQQRLKQQSDKDEPCVLSWIKAHRPGCAIFAVKVTTISLVGAGDSRHFCVATCSDDRSATLHVATDATCTLMEGMTWACCWRGCGSSFARRRVFDVSILVAPGDCSALFLATGGEDGSVHAFAFCTRQLVAAAAAAAAEVAMAVANDEAAGVSVTPESVLRRLQQHDGRGVYKVALLVDPHTAVVALVSCGFDGSANLATLSSFPIRRSVLASNSMEQTHQKHIRGVICDEQGTLLACTEDELISLPVDMDQGDQRLPIPTSRAIKDLPSCISIVMRSAQLPSFALIGTTGGNVYGVRNTAAAAEQLDGMQKTTLLLLAASSSSSAASKVLLVRGLWWKDHLLLASVHANGRLIVSVLPHIAEPPVVWVTVPCAGVHSTALSVCLVGHAEEEKFCVFVGDDGGGLSVELVDLCGDKRVTTLLHREPLFQQPVVSVHRTEVVKRKGRLECMMGVSVQGEWRVFLLDACARHVDIPPVSCLLRLPWRISSLLACNDTVAVTQFGTDITVFMRFPFCFSWQPVAQYHGMKAPRLLSATIPTTPAADMPIFVSHCSNGVQVECHTCSEVSRTRVLHGGAVVGREYNAVLFLPSPASSFVCGSENSMMTVVPSLVSSVVSHMEGPLTISGPHESNILSMALCSTSGSNDNGSNNKRDSTWFVTAGGLATLALWEWSVHYSWRVLAHVSVKQQQQRWRRGGGEGEGGGKQHVHEGHFAAEGASGQGVPRFLAVCTTFEDIVVGSSDGTLKVFSLSTKLELLLELRLSASTPKPVTAVATLCAADRLVVVGDTSGLVGVCNVATGVIVSHHFWTRASVNALAVGRRLDDSLDAWHVLAAMDSGDVVLLRVGVVDISVVCSVRVGLTAGRGVSWLPESCQKPLQQVQDEVKSEEKDEGVDGAYAVVVNDERLTLLLVCGTAAELRIAGHRRLNVRGVSGLAITPAMTCMVVGQGVEVLQLVLSHNGSTRGGDAVEG